VDQERNSARFVAQGLNRERPSVRNADPKCNVKQMDFLRKIILEINTTPIILSHHPLCGAFSDHYFSIRGHYVCKGCITVYPVAIITIILMSLFDVTTFSFLFYTALVFFILNCYRFVIPRREIVNNIMNIMLGISLGAVVLSVIHVPNDISLSWGIIVLVVASIFIFLKGFRVFNVCRHCPRYDSFPRCTK